MMLTTILSKRIFSGSSISLQFRQHVGLSRSFNLAARNLASSTNSNNKNGKKPGLPPTSKKILNKSLTLLKFGSEIPDVTAASDKKTLVVLLGWLMSSDKNMEKYVQIYAKHNYDVLLVKTFPTQLMLPKSGSMKIADDILSFAVDNNKYSNLLIHGFSIGGYQFGEMLVKLTQNPELAKKFSSLVKACIFDSAVDLNSLPRGFSKAISPNVIVQNLSFLMMSAYLKLFYFIATKYYSVSEREFFAMKHFAVPSLMIVSERDKIGTIESNQRVMDSWTKRGVPVKMKIFKDSKHVCHYLKYPEEYEREIDQVLKNAKLI